MESLQPSIFWLKSKEGEEQSEIGFSWAWVLLKSNKHSRSWQGFKQKTSELEQLHRQWDLIHFWTSVVLPWISSLVLCCILLPGYISSRSVLCLTAQNQLHDPNLTLKGASSTICTNTCWDGTQIYVQKCWSVRTNGCTQGRTRFKTKKVMLWNLNCPLMFFHKCLNTAIYACEYFF